jgi:hypothetical protein
MALIIVSAVAFLAADGSVVFQVGGRNGGAAAGGDEQAAAQAKGAGSRRFGAS